MQNEAQQERVGKQGDTRSTRLMIVIAGNRPNEPYSLTCIAQSADLRERETRMPSGQTSRTRLTSYRMECIHCQADPVCTRVGG